MDLVVGPPFCEWAGGRKVYSLHFAERTREEEGKDWGMITNLFEREMVERGKKDRKIGAAKSKGIPRGGQASERLMISGGNPKPPPAPKVKHQPLRPRLDRTWTPSQGFSPVRARRLLLLQI